MNCLTATSPRSLSSACAALLLSLLLATPAPAASQPNIVLILVDDLGKEWISCYGAEQIETPHIDRLAEGGMKFTNAYSMPQCTPTRATLLTGQYPFRNGWTNHWDVPRWGAGCHFDPNHNLTFARLLRDGGYATAIAGKWQINDFRVQPNVLREHGFNEWSMWTGYESHNPPSANRYWDPYVYTSMASSQTYAGRFGPDLYNEFLAGFIRRHRDQPMLLYYPMALTHTPLVHTPREPDAETNLQKHKAMVRYTDHLVGRLVAALEEAEIRDRTIIIFTTDNGTARSISGRRHGRLIQGGKALLAEPGVNVPFIVNGPGIVPAGVTADALTDFSDLFPTFVELAGAKIPENVTIDGHSIAPVILGKDNDGPRDWVLTMGRNPAALDSKGVRPYQNYSDRALRDKRYKLHVLDGKPAALYGLREDPAEERNLIESRNPEHRAALAKFQRILSQFPETDARPRYDPTPPQPWDVLPQDFPTEKQKKAETE